MKGISGRLWIWILVLAVATLTMTPLGVYARVFTDQPSYSPGDIVTISGDNSDNAGYLPGELVNVAAGILDSYSASCSATADAAGAWSCQMTLPANDTPIGTS